MKKLMLLSLGLVLLAFAFAKTYAQTSFTQAIKTCEEYKNQGSIRHQDEIFNILITLNKAKGNRCIYKEKIYQDDKYQMLTCEFKQSHQDYIADSMNRFSQEFRKEIAKNNIFEAKLTTNAEVFQKYLVNADMCKITYSK